MFSGDDGEGQETEQGDGIDLNQVAATWLSLAMDLQN